MFVASSRNPSHLITGTANKLLGLVFKYRSMYIYSLPVALLEHLNTNTLLIEVQFG